MKIKNTVANKMVNYSEQTVSKGKNTASQQGMSYYNEIEKHITGEQCKVLFVDPKCEVD